MKESCQKGRTLIEMIGVLGIIGLLTVGALSGYSVAIDSMKVREMGEDLFAAAQNIKKLYSWQKNYKEITLEGTNLPQKLCKEEIFPSGCITKDGTTTIKHALGGTVTVTAPADGASFSLNYSGLSSEECFKIASQNLHFIDIVIDGAAHTGTTYEAPLTSAEAAAICLPSSCTSDPSSSSCKNARMLVSFYYK
ncbi:MAG: hypothetical protein EOM53_01500 [Alphaproteobacteria bacterium]|nr:type 4 pilus major pilin [Alphaproteobacteria bacterium]NCB49343.1 hypothetical protein [Alphaproteobacteria bacterium]